MDATLHFVIGGARSGKSRFAEALVAAHPPPWRYLATAEALDAEMAARIAAHRARRDGRWTTVEAPRDLVAALASAGDGPLLVDCLTLWLANVMLAGMPARATAPSGGAHVDEACDALVAELAAPRGPWVVVANEVGMGLVPDTPLGREFRDAQGRLNQAVAAAAHDVTFVAAGLPLRLKG